MPTSRTSQFRIAVTGFISATSSAPGTNVARCLREAYGKAVCIVAIDNLPISPTAGLNDLVDETLLCPPAQLSALFLDFVCSLRETYGIDAAVFTDDQEIEIASRHASKIKGTGLRFLAPSQDSVAKVRREAIPILIPGLGYSTPDTVVLNVPDDLWRINVKLGYPVVLKGPGCGVRMARSFADALTAFHRISRGLGGPVIAQRYVEGDELSVTALADRGILIGAAPIKKLGITEKGNTWAGVTIRSAKMVDLARRLVETLSWHGPFEVEVIRQPHSGSMQVLEINPRFPSWIYLPALAGMNLPRAYVDLALGFPVEELTSYVPGTGFIREETEAFFRIDTIAHALRKHRMNVTSSEYRAP